MALFTSAGIAGLLGVSAGLFTTVSAFALNAAVGIGLNLLASSIAGQPEQPTFSVQGQLQVGGDIPRSFILGRTATAGSLVYANTWGNAGKTPNAYFTQVIALSDLPVQELTAIWVNGQRCTMITSEPHGHFGFPLLEYRSGGKDHLWVKLYDGNQLAEDPYLVEKVSSAERPYEATRVGVGVAFATCTALINENLFTGFPSYKFEVLGLRLYDITKDSTAGGSGTHRLANPATWGGDGDELPAVQAYNLLLGLKFGSQWFYGLQGMSAPRLPSADWRAQVAKCRLGVSKPGGGTEVQYLTGFEVQVNAPITKAVETILTGCQGRLIDIGGTYKMRVGAPDAAVFSFSDGDILSTERQTFTPFFGLADTINGVSATYPEPEEGWNNKAAPSLYRPDYEARDDNRRLMANVDLAAVRRASQVQRLMKSALEEARRARRHTIVLGPSAWVLEPGDVVTWTSGRNGYAAKLMRVDGVVDKANLDVILDLTEVDPAAYNWNPATDFRAPTFGPLGSGRPAAQAIVDWFAQPWTLNDSAGNARRPAIKLSWDGDQPDVIGVEFEVYLASAPAEPVYRGRADNALAGAIIISQNLLPAQNYSVRGRYIPGGDRLVLWSGFLPVTTPNVMITDVSTDLAHLERDALSRFEELQAEMDDFFRPRLVELTEAFSLQGALGETRRQELLASIGQSFAEIVQEARVRASEDAALAQFYTSLSAQVGTNLARLITEETARATGDSALANSLGILSADVGTNLARLITEETARANGDSALASSVSDLSGQVGTNLARLITEETARANGDSALTTSVSDLTSQVGTNLARLVTEETTRANADSALSSSVTGVSADLNGRFAQGLMTLQAAASQAGVDARFAIMLRAGTGATFKESGLYLELYTEGGVQKSRVAIIADQFIVSDGTNSAKPLAFVGGVLKLINAQIEQAQIENLIVGTHNIAPEAATAMAAGDGYSVTFGSSFTTIAAVDLVHGAGNPKVTIDWAVLTPGVAVEYRVVNASTGYVMFTYSFPATANNWCCLAQDVSDKSALLSSLYYLQARSFSAGSFTHPFAIIRAIALKR